MQIDMRNMNVIGRSRKEGMKYELHAEITEEDFDQLRAMNLTGTCAVVNLEFTAGEEPQPEKPKGGPLSISAAGLCMTPKFFEFVWTYGVEHESIALGPTTEEYQAEYCRGIILDRCQISSRAELDHNPEAAAKFRELMRQYREWLEK